jgi:hypothetical protein
MAVAIAAEDIDISGKNRPVVLAGSGVVVDVPVDKATLVRREAAAFAIAASADPRLAIKRNRTAMTCRHEPSLSAPHDFINESL